LSPSAAYPLARRRAAGGRPGPGRAVFLDKDGTLLENVPYNVDPDLMRLAPGVGEALLLLQRAGFLLFVVSNQSGVARGFFNESDLEPVWRRLRELLSPAGVIVTDIYYCPHHPQGSVDTFTRECGCRKPAPGMLLEAAEEHGVDLGSSWMVGDILDDVEAGQRAGCRTALIDNGNETEWQMSPSRTPHVLVDDLRQAAEAILAASPTSLRASWGSARLPLRYPHEGERG
jgi:D-glycero-D-manno-heptose 1,7-bisphosphate phosphatase